VTTAIAEPADAANRRTLRRDRRLVRLLLGWFQSSARDLPWRRQRDPYRSLVSEMMLQQTQVARVIDPYTSLIWRYPTPADLARADEADVLALWSGLGYYSRARNLHAAAVAVAGEHAGRVPTDPEALRRLPGVGRYTAGAVASMAGAKAVAAVDGNAARVLMRLEACKLDQGAGRVWAWRRAEGLVRCCAAERGDHVVGTLNEALMELGATRCLPRSPRCGGCPLERMCRARAAGLEQRIPAPRTATTRRLLYATSLLLIDRRGRRLIERRGNRGMWAGLWQTPTMEREDRHATGPELARHLRQRSASVIARARPRLDFEHLTTHRLVRFRVFEARIVRVPRLGPGPAGRPRRWIDPARIAGLGLSSPQRRILTLAGEGVDIDVS